MALTKLTQEGDKCLKIIIILAFVEEFRVILVFYNQIHVNLLNN